VVDGVLVTTRVFYIVGGFCVVSAARGVLMEREKSHSGPSCMQVDIVHVVYFITCVE
jgi:hypothetical protein